ncbi:hypothetical protein OB947_19535 [Aeromonas bestiarum]|uniref:hypothetical protein n=1 Tax=Aeromonas bestiarum TaxID=105751 RepID=UPI00259F1B44|nr:hypothetical protein [Aeromonas bestiarum]MDM5091069.1 hypothetical protein [Aeromonas bestiarum]
MEMLTERKEKWWKVSVWLLSFISVFVVLMLYHFFIWLKGGPIFPKIQPTNITTILGIVTSFSITMTGFIAAIGAYLLSVSRNPTFSEWRNNGYLSIFFNLYGAAIIFLLGTFGASLMMLVATGGMWWLKIILSLVVVNLIHVITITYIVVNQAKVNDEN